MEHLPLKQRRSGLPFVPPAGGVENQSELDLVFLESKVNTLPAAGEGIHAGQKTSFSINIMNQR